MLVVACLLALSSVAFSATVRRGHPLGWVERQDREVDANSRVQFRLALPQKNLDVLARETIERGTPSNPKYGEWLTSKQVLDMIAPDDEVVETVVSWARSQGLQADGSRRDIVLVEGTKTQVEQALKTRLSTWQHESGHSKVCTLEYSLPDYVNEHVELLIGLTEFWTPPSGPKIVALDEPSVLSKRNSVVAGYVIPDTVRNLYNIPKDSFRDVSALSSIGVAEFEDAAHYSKSDLSAFDTATGELHSHVDHVVGPFQGFSPNLECQLDIEYASTLALNSSYWYWTADKWMMEFANDFYARATKPDVISMSWGWPEPQQCQITSCNGMTSKQYVERVNTEFNKITATGVTLFASSGDQGAPGDSYASSCDGLSTIFPGASPWVTSVGATMLSNTAPHPPAPPNQPPACSQFPCSTVTVEAVCSIPEALITTGGGFSDYFTRPTWQEKAVHAYFRSNASFPSSQYFNRGNRAFPDISAMGHAVLIEANGRLLQVDGTSCSAPILAAMWGLLNGWRINNGKAKLGFSNPLIYEAFGSNPGIFNDLTWGNNKCSEGCCGTIGFEAAPGWDATTGVGTPDFTKLLNYVQSLQ